MSRELSDCGRSRSPDSTSSSQEHQRGKRSRSNEDKRETQPPLTTHDSWVWNQKPGVLDRNFHRVTTTVLDPTTRMYKEEWPHDVRLGVPQDFWACGCCLKETNSPLEETCLHCFSQFDSKNDTCHTLEPMLWITDCHLSFGSKKLRSCIRPYVSNVDNIIFRKRERKGRNVWALIFPGVEEALATLTRLMREAEQTIRGFETVITLVGPNSEAEGDPANQTSGKHGIGFPCAFEWRGSRPFHRPPSWPLDPLESFQRQRKNPPEAFSPTFYSTEQLQKIIQGIDARWSSATQAEQNFYNTHVSSLLAAQQPSLPTASAVQPPPPVATENEGPKTDVAPDRGTRLAKLREKLAKGNQEGAVAVPVASAALTLQQKIALKKKQLEEKKQQELQGASNAGATGEPAQVPCVYGIPFPPSLRIGSKEFTFGPQSPLPKLDETVLQSVKAVVTQVAEA